MKKNIFLYSGEGTRSSETRYKLLKHSAYWLEIENILSSKLNLNLEQLWNLEIGRHRCPHSPLLTVITQICLSDIWRQWGYRPDVVIGHSTGELSAAYQAGFYTLEEVLLLAFGIGEVAARLDGVMIHGWLSDALIRDLKVNLSSFNFESNAGKHVTLSGYPDEIDEFLDQHPDFVKMKLPHPWHHPDYRKFLGQLAPIKSIEVQEGIFVSGVTTKFETRLDEDHWHQWLIRPVDFIKSMQAIKEPYDDYHLDIIEIGFHSVLEKCCEIFRDYSYISSMFRGEDEINWILYQRRKLDQEVILKKIKEAIDEFKPQLDFDASLAYQGLGSLDFARLTVILQPYFPSLAPQDFYRYKTINRLIDRFGVEKPVEPRGREVFLDNQVVISGMSCRFPNSVETPAQFWDMLLSNEDQVRRVTGRGGDEAGFLDNSISRFDHRYFNISSAECRTMDPQQVLALELTEMLWKDADIDPETLDKKRVGVYIGVWNQEYHGDKTSVFYPTGTNPSIIASRISYHYDLRGPSWVSNTACSSSLVAVHYAIKDIEAGRVDYAIAGGVNMLLDENFTANMRNSGFLSEDNRCKAFDNTANGYVRAEGGGLILLVNKSLADKYYTEISGSSINQNGRRSQVITAPHPEAQEELIMTACEDAGIIPQDISYIECHGTGTKIGDPVEISAILNTAAKHRKDICHIGSVKSNFGHLESAAGIGGLIKSVAILCHGIIPPNLHFNNPNEYIDFKSHNIRVVTEKTKIDQQAYIGVSSFGFGGSNAHIIIKGVEASVRKEIRPLKIPFDRERAVSLFEYIRNYGPDTFGSAAELIKKNNVMENVMTREDIDKLVGELFYQLTNIQEINPEIELTDQGLDSMSGTELISQLETSLKIEIEPDLLLENPLREQFVDEVYALADGARK